MERHYGWVIVAIGALMGCVGMGSMFSLAADEWLPVIWGGEEQSALNQRQPPFQLVAASRQQEAE